MANYTSVLPFFREPDWTPSHDANAFPYFAVALVLQLVVFVGETYIDLRQRRHLQNPQFPSGVADAFALVEKTKKTDAETPPTASMRTKYDQSRAYGLDKLSLALVARAVRQSVTSGILVLGVLPYAWTLSGRALEWLGADAQKKEISRTLVFFTFALARDALVALPLSLYSAFVVEARHGFNTQTLGAFFLDAIKLAALLLVVGNAVAAAMVLVAHAAGDLFFAYVPVVYALLMTVGFGLFTVLAPLLTELTPLEDGALTNKIRALALAQQLPLATIVVQNASSSSTHSNASVLGIGATKTIYVDDTLLAELEDDEVLAVLCHEFGHVKKAHLPRALAMQALSQFLKLFVFSRCMRDASLYAGLGFATHAGLPHALIVGYTLFSSALWLPMERVLQFSAIATSRKYEREADLYATDLGHGEALTTGLTKLLVQNLATLHPDSLYSAYHFHHPSLLERLDAISTRMEKKKTA